VVGSSHSAILVLMNLLEMKNGPRVVNLHRSSLKYAKFRDDGTIILDNTGLKVMICSMLCHARSVLPHDCNLKAPNNRPVLVLRINTTGLQLTHQDVRIAAAPTCTKQLHCRPVSRHTSLSKIAAVVTVHCLCATSQREGASRMNVLVT